MDLLLFVDTDPGVDDALALLMAHCHARVAALGVAAGNVGLEHTVGNALKLLDVIGAETAVYPGCATPLVLPAADAAFVHGKDGFGDTGYQATVRGAASEHAALALLRLSHEYSDQLTLVALGPLTNLALALRLDPTLPSRIPRLVIMGGAVTGRGNTSVSAEFNIAFDPESAHVVFSTWPRFDLVDWESTVRHAIAFDRFEAWLLVDDARARFFDAISRKVRVFTRERGRAGMIAADALAMAVALSPGIVTEWAERHVCVELGGAQTRGATIVDWDRRNGQPANARIALSVDQRAFETMVAGALGAA